MNALQAKRVSENLPPVFHNGSDIFHSDTCDSLTMAANKGDLTLKALSLPHYPGICLKNSVLPGICSLGYWDAQKHQEWGLQWHRNEGIEICFLERGYLDFEVENSSYLLKKQWATLTRPWQMHRVGKPFVTPSKLFWLIIDVGVRRPHDEWKWPEWVILSEHEKSHLTRMLSTKTEQAFLSTSEIAHCFSQIEPLLNVDDANMQETQLKLAINQLLLSLALEQHMASEVNEELSSSRYTVQLFLNHLKKNPEEPWTLESMALECRLGKSQFLKYVRDLTSMSPNDFQQLCRIEKACDLISDDANKNLTKIAFDCGFSSSGYFSTVFKKHMRLSPRQFAQKVGQK
jgi:AraC-like DNA-binding protein